MSFRYFDYLAWLSAGIIVGAFFLPWLGLNSGEKAVAEVLARKLAESADRSVFEQYFAISDEEKKQALEKPLDGVSGYALVDLLRNGNRTGDPVAKIAASFLGEERVRDRAFLIYVIPVTAILAAAYAFTCRRNRWFLLIPLLVCELLYYAVRENLNDIYFDRIMSQIHVGIGLWLSLYGLLALALVIVVRLLMPTNSRW
jgi:hypothetical protein